MLELISDIFISILNIIILFKGISYCNYERKTNKKVYTSIACYTLVLTTFILLIYALWFI